jgi:hypothetical protein
MNKKTLQITLSGDQLAILEKIAEASNKRMGAILGEMVRDMLDSLIPVLNAGSEAQAYKIMFREALNKITVLFDDIPK